MSDFRSDFAEIKSVSGVTRAYLFGSYLNDKFPKDIDVLLVGNQAEIDFGYLESRLSIPIKRIQANQYKRQDHIEMCHQLKYDFLILDSDIAVQKFVAICPSEVIEI